MPENLIVVNERDPETGEVFTVQKQIEPDDLINEVAERIANHVFQIEHGSWAAIVRYAKVELESFKLVIESAHIAPVPDPSIVQLIEEARRAHVHVVAGSHGVCDEPNCLAKRLVAALEQQVTARGEAEKRLRAITTEAMHNIPLGGILENGIALALSNRLARIYELTQAALTQLDKPTGESEANDE